MLKSDENMSAESKEYIKLYNNNASMIPQLLNIILQNKDHNLGPVFHIIVSTVLLYNTNPDALTDLYFYCLNLSDTENNRLRGLSPFDEKNIINKK